MNYDLVKLFLGAAATLGLYSVLYRENRFYRLCEHVYLGLAVGFSLVAIWKETLYSSWWLAMVGTHTPTGVAVPGHWAWVMVVPFGALGYTVFSQKYNWLSRIPIGILLGLSAGQYFQAWQQQYIPQITNTLRPILPNTKAYFHPGFDVMAKMPAAQQAIVKDTVYGSQALTNFIFLATILCVFSYFIFTVDIKSRFIRGMSNLGRWLLMVGFGAIFGSTVMTRFALLIDRMYFIFIEFLKQGVFHLH